MDWPAVDKAPRAFVAQLDLAEVRTAEGPEWLPAEGRLYAFYDPDGAGCADHVAILSSLDAAGTTRVHTPSPPPTIPPR